MHCLMNAISCNYFNFIFFFIFFFCHFSFVSADVRLSDTPRISSDQGNLTLYGYLAKLELSESFQSLSTTRTPTLDVSRTHPCPPHVPPQVSLLVDSDLEEAPCPPTPALTATVTRAEVVVNTVLVLLLTSYHAI